MMAQILNEVYFVEQEQLSNKIQISSDGIVSIKGVILSKTEEKNKNNRVYPKNIFEREINKLLPKIQGRMLRGELDHPEERLEVLLREGSHLITASYWDPQMPTWVRGDIEILKTPLGGLVEVYVKQRSPVGLSSRGEGSLVFQDGYHVVQEDFNLRTWDIVSDQSTMGAVLNESIASGMIVLDKNTEPILEKYYKEYNENQEKLYEQIKGALRGEAWE